MEKTYTVPIDSSIKVITSIVIAMILGFTLLLLFTYTTVLLIILLGLIGLTFYCYMYCPRKYTVSVGGIRIIRKAKDLMISKESIEDIEMVDTKQLGSLIRTGAVGGLFGYFGNMTSAKYGLLKVYVRSFKSKLFLIKTKDRNILLCPDNAEDFYSECHSVLNLKP